MIDLINVINSLAMVVIHAIDTYSWPYKGLETGETNKIIVIIEISLNIYFLIDFLLNFYVSENKLLFAFNTQSILEYISILPALLCRLEVY